MDIQRHGLTRTQEDAVRGCVRRIQEGERKTLLFGFAGTGKTTIARFVAEDLGGNVVFATVTNKAVSVLRDNGCAPAYTIKSLFFTPIGEVIDKEGNRHPVFDKRLERFQEEHGRVSAIILDESSMVDQEDAQVILSAKIPVLAIGDPFQLQPVEGKPYFTLEEVKRHDSKILELATDIRLNGVMAVRKRQYRGIVVPSLRDYYHRGGSFGNFDQVLVGRHTTRWQKNLQIRDWHGFDSDDVSRGDLIIGMDSNKNRGLINGQHYNVIDVRQQSDYGKGQGYGTGKTFIEILLCCDCRLFIGGAPYSWSRRCPECQWSPDWVQTWPQGFQSLAVEDELKKKLSFFSRQRAFTATFGYAITVHKSQGSEWNSVLVVNENWCWKQSGEDANWLYTAVTRAREKLVVIPGPNRRQLDEWAVNRFGSTDFFGGR